MKAGWVTVYLPFNQKTSGIFFKYLGYRGEDGVVRCWGVDIREWGGWAAG